MDRRHRLMLAASALVCASLVYVYPLALPTPLLNPDEGLHASISQEMVERGDYVVPRISGQPFLDKPILYFEAQALSLRTFGMNEAAVRLPGLLFALLGAATTAIVARRLFDVTTGFMALLVALTSIVPMALAQAAAHDVALVPWTNMLLLCLWEADHEPARRRRVGYIAGAAVCIGLALLTKGLIGIAVVMVGYALYLALTRQVALPLIARGAAALAGGIVLASPWFIAMELRSPGYLYYYFVQRHLMGFATTTQTHGHEPWYFYLPLLLGGALPWILYLGPGLWQTWTDRRGGKTADLAATLFVSCWLVGGLAFLSVAKSKLITYALPLYPAVAILAAHAWKQFLNGELSAPLENAFAWLFRLCSWMGCVVPVVLLVALDRVNHATSPTAAYAAAGVAAAIMIAAFVLFQRGRRVAAVATGTTWFAVLFVMVMTWPMQGLAERYSQRALAEQIVKRPNLPERIVLVGDRVASIVFYLTPAQRRELRPDQIVETNFADINNWQSLPPKTLLAVPETWLADIKNASIRQCVSAGASAGRYRVAESAGGAVAGVDAGEIRK